MKRRGIILAGGSGSRLYPATLVVSKSLLPIFDKPMIYYPLCTLMLAGIRDVLIITKPRDLSRFQELLGDGSQWGIRIVFETQTQPNGIAEALLIGEEFLDGGPSAVILGDNIFYGSSLERRFCLASEQPQGATVFAYRVRDPDRYGVVTFDGDGRAVSIEEKPKHPTSSFAVTGLYFYDGRASQFARRLKPSARGELEITDLNRAYLEHGALRVERLDRGYAWLDTGTPDSMLEAHQFVQSIEHRQGIKLASPEEIAFRRGWICGQKLRELAEPLSQSSYGRYLVKVLKETTFEDKKHRDP